MNPGLVCVENSCSQCVNVDDESDTEIDLPFASDVCRLAAIDRPGIGSQAATGAETADGQGILGAGLSAGGTASNRAAGHVIELVSYALFAV